MVRRTAVLLVLMVCALVPRPSAAQIVFRAGSSFPVAQSPRYFAVGDFNRDGIDDLAVSSPREKTVTVLLGGDPDGFKIGIAQSVGSIRNGRLAVGDLNGDGLLDIVVTDARWGLWVLLGNGDGTFRSPALVRVLGRSKGVAIGDFGPNGNDLAVTDIKKRQVLLFENDGFGSFSVPAGFVPPGAPVKAGSIVAADFNGDGRLDVAMLSEQSSSARQVAVLLGAGGSPPQFTRVGSFTVGARPETLVLADFNDDGRMDLGTANAYPAYNGADVSFLISLGDGTFVSESLATCPTQLPNPIPTTLCAAAALGGDDLDSNGTTDLAVAVRGGDLVTGADVLELFSGSGSGSFTKVQTLPLSGPKPSAIAIGNFTGHGQRDVAVGSFENNTVQVFPSATLVVQVGSAIVQQGSSASINVNLKAIDEQVASVQAEIAFDPDTPIVSCAVNPAINKPDSNFAFLPSGCTVGVDCQAVQAAILSLSNLSTIPNGSELFTCSVDVSSTAHGGVHPLSVIAVGASDPSGRPLDVVATDGSVVVTCVGMGC